MELTITRHVDPEGNGTLKLAGSIDMMTRDRLKDAGMAILREGGTLTLDLGEVDFLDSMGIGALVELTKASQAHGRRLVVSARSPRVTRVLEVTGLDEAWAEA